MNSEPIHLDSAGDDPSAPSPMYSLEAERALLCCCLVFEGDTLTRCRNAGLTWRSFFFRPHGLVYGALQKLVEKFGKVDGAMLAEFLKERGKLDEVGGYAGISAMTSANVTTAGAPFLVEQVMALWHRRRANEILLGALEQVRLTRAWTDVQAELGTAAGKLGVLKFDKGKPLTEVATAAREKLAELVAGTAAKPDRIVTGLRKFDETLFPFDPSIEDYLVLIMGPPSFGKSSLARNIVAANLARNKRIVVFLLETGDEMYLKTMACEMARVNMLRLEELPNDIASRLDQASAEIGQWCEKGLLHVFDDVEEIDAIESRCKLIAETVGPIDCVVVDYVQLVRTKKKCFNREQEVADISARLLRLGKTTLKAVILGLAQMNREAQKEKRLPRLTDLRESGALGQDACRVIGIHRPAEDCRGAEQTENQATYEQWLVQLKHRNGPTGYIKTWFRKTYTRFEDMRKDES